MYYVSSHNKRNGDTDMTTYISNPAQYHVTQSQENAALEIRKAAAEREGVAFHRTSLTLVFGDTFELRVYGDARVSTHGYQISKRGKVAAQ